MNHINHVAIIMDGNGRWGIKKKNNRNFGHRKGLNSIKNIVKHSIKKKIKFLTLFAFSTENWKRPIKEIDFLFSLLDTFLTKNLYKMHKDNIRIFFIGSKKKIKNNIIKKMLAAEKLTKFNTKLCLNIALNYGSKQEIVNAVRLIKKKKLRININNIDKNLYTKNIPNPDILIRTGDTHRLSNFMLWQLDYAEIFFEKKLWPDFDSKDYNNILTNYQKIKRTFGGINE
jgi:undecaprenyl diphosphate synthase